MPGIRHVLLGVACLAHSAVGNPFAADTNRSVALHDLKEEEVQQYAAAKSRDYHVVLLFNLDTEEMQRSCAHHCPWTDMQIEALAEGYTKQLRGGEVYTEGSRPLYFARVRVPNKEAKVAKAFRVASFPSLIFMPAGSAAGVKYGSAVLRTPQPKDSRREEKNARNKASKDFRYLKRAASRHDRRRRQITTQEEREEPDYGVRNYHIPNMNNLCKWLKLRAGHQISMCPQDVDHSAVAKQGKSEIGKQIVVAAVAFSALLYFARVFSIGLGVIDYSLEDLRRSQLIAQGVRTVSDQHVAYRAKDSWWTLWTTLAAVLASGVVGCCASGMYWNFLHNTPVLGDSFRPPLSRVTGYGKEVPHFSLALAGVVMFCTLLMVALGRAATINHIALKVPVVLSLGVVLVVCGLMVLSVFAERSRGYLQNTPMSYFIYDIVLKL